jgi:hypothetical protein
MFMGKFVNTGTINLVLIVRRIKHGKPRELLQGFVLGCFVQCSTVDGDFRMGEHHQPIYLIL